METVVGLFERYEDADRAVRALEFAGMPEGISVVSRDKMVRERVERVETSNWANDVAEGAGAGAVGGTLVGGLAGFFLGATAVLIPGIGPALAGGALAAALGAAAAGAGIGAATGGILGALIGLGIPKEEAHIYAEGVRRGGILVTVRAPDAYAADIAHNIMRDSNAIDINRWTNELRAGGWTEFHDETAPDADAPSIWTHTHRRP